MKQNGLTTGIEIKMEVFNTSINQKQFAKNAILTGVLLPSTYIARLPIFSNIKQYFRFKDRQELCYQKTPPSENAVQYHAQATCHKKIQAK